MAQGIISPGEGFWSLPLTLLEDSSALSHSLRFELLFQGDHAAQGAQDGAAVKGEGQRKRNPSVRTLMVVVVAAAVVNMAKQ